MVFTTFQLIDTQIELFINSPLNAEGTDDTIAGESFRQLGIQGNQRFGTALLAFANQLAHEEGDYSNQNSKNYRTYGN